MFFDDKKFQSEYYKHIGPLTATTTALIAFGLYIWTVAPGLTWAHHGVDGGDFLAAAVTNGIPHPSGYPLYILLLQGWLSLLGWLWPDSNVAWQGNLFSAFCAACSVGITVLVMGHLYSLNQKLSFQKNTQLLYSHWLWSGLISLLWAISPLLWEQAVITEVYALHALLITLLGWALFNKRGQAKYMIPIVALGLANHLTFVLLLPAALYYLWLYDPETDFSRKNSVSKNTKFIPALSILALGCLLSLLFYIRIPIAASGTPPISWGDADNWAGFWWLISGQAYQGYLFELPTTDLIGRLAAWVNILTEQYTLLGLGIALISLYHLDSHHPKLRNFGLLWLLPISLYAIGYYTSDSNIYLLSATWLLLIWLMLGLPIITQWASDYIGSQANALLMAVVALGIVAILFWRLPDITLQDDHEAEDFISAVLAVTKPGNIIITQADAQTFAVWYSAWASGDLLKKAPDSVLINYPLYENFAWYRQNLAETYAHVPAIGEPLPAFLEVNRAERAIFFGPILVEQGGLDGVQSDLEPAGQLWRYR